MTNIPIITWSISEIAERDKVSRQAVSKQIRRLVELQPDTPTVLDARGRIVGVSIAHYDQHRERFVDPARAERFIQPAEKTSSTPLAADSFEEARRRSEWMKVSRESLRHQEEVSQLVRTDKIRESVKVIGAEIKTTIARLPNSADDLALAISREGVHGARAALRKIAFELGNHIADKLADIAKNAPVYDPMIDDENPYQNIEGEAL